MSLPAVVVLIACNVDNSHLPGLANELPNRQGTPVSLPVDAGGGGSTTTTTTTPAGPAQSLCDCADSYTAGEAACTSCSGTMCSASYTKCQGGDCGNAIVCVFNCSDDGPCIAGCIDQFPDYQAFMSCLLLDGCAASCGEPTPLSCPLSGTDGGSDGSADAATD